MVPTEPLIFGVELLLEVEAVELEIPLGSAT